MTQKAMVVLSGGQDSTTCLYWALDRGYDVHTITFDYGQRHQRELEAAATIAGMAGVDPYKSEFAVIGRILKGVSPLVNEDSKLEQYADMHSLPGGLEKTFVPMRNQLFLTLAANRAYSIGANILVTGVCQEDFGGYPDCRRVFIEALERACNIGTFTGDEDTLPPLHIVTPLMNLTKAQSVRMALELPGCYRALAYSHTSYDGQYPPIGKDHATLLRAKGFAEAMVPDPLVLRAHSEGKMDLPDSANYAQRLVEEYNKWIS
jgi:7-cyano-7-deazaguanine synthase